jgi:hypothetical protein
MLIQKTFHLQMTQAIAKQRLSYLHGYGHQLVDVEEAALEGDGMAHLRFRLPYGFRGCIDLEEVPGVNPAQTLFRSQGGNVEVLGVLEYFEIEPRLTEVVLTLDYTIESPLFRLIDYLSNGVDRFLNRQLERIENYFSRSSGGIRADRNLQVPINGYGAEPG